MPTYQYACTEPDCGNRFEQVQAFTDPSVSECPVCNGNVRKVYGSVGVVFKGSGFYRNDSRSASGSTDSPKSESKSESKSDSKADAKSDSSGKTESSTKTDSKPTAGSSTSTSTAKSA